MRKIQVKCYGSTAASKSARQGSIPCACATIFITAIILSYLAGAHNTHDAAFYEGASDKSIWKIQGAIIQAYRNGRESVILEVINGELVQVEVASAR